MLFVARLIGPEAAGIAMVALAAFQLPELLAATLFTEALVQRRNLGVQHAESAATVAVIVGATAGLLLAGAGPFLAAGAGYPTLAWLMLALAPLLPLSAYVGASQAILLRERHYRLLAMRIVVGQPMALIAAVLAALAGAGAWAIIVGQAVGTLVAFLLALRFGRIRLRRRLDRGALSELWPIAGPQVAATVVNVGKYRLFLVALGLIASSAVVAQAHLAFRMLDVVLMIVWQVSSRLALPRLCALSDDRTAIAGAYGELTQLQALLGFPIAVGVALVAPDLVQALLGPSWAGTGDAARIVGLTVILVFLSGPYTSLFVALQRPRWNLWFAIATLVLPLVALLLVRPETPAGIALAWSTQCLVLPPLLIWLVLREVRRTPSWLARDLAPATIATMAMAVMVLLVKQQLSLPPLLAVATDSAVGVTVFAVVAWCMLGLRPPPALVWTGQHSAQTSDKSHV
jgi:PST family polysaccharide transporter